MTLIKSFFVICDVQMKLYKYTVDVYSGRMQCTCQLAFKRLSKLLELP